MKKFKLFMEEIAKLSEDILEESTMTIHGNIRGDHYNTDDLGAIKDSDGRNYNKIMNIVKDHAKKKIKFDIGPYVTKSSNRLDVDGYKIKHDYHDNLNDYNQGSYKHTFTGSKKALEHFKAKHKLTSHIEHRKLDSEGKPIENHHIKFHSEISKVVNSKIGEGYENKDGSRSVVEDISAKKEKDLHNHLITKGFTYSKEHGNLGSIRHTYVSNDGKKRVSLLQYNKGVAPHLRSLTINQKD